MAFQAGKPPAVRPCYHAGMNDQRPNILLVFGEDTGLHLGCYGYPDARTPRLDRFAGEGLRATHAFTHSPVCAPSRSGFVTGRYPYSYGGHNLRCTLCDPPPMFTRALKDAGYHVTWHEKTDFNFPLPERDISDTADWRRNGFPTGRPWFAYTNLNHTHESMMWPGDASERNRAMQFMRDALPGRDPATLHVIPPYLPDVPEVRACLARHHDNFTLVDWMFGRILDQLEASGQADRTIVIFMTDHGAGIPRGKRWCYDLGMHLPLLIRWPGRIAPGTVHTGMVGWVDIAPQILAWCGAPCPTGLHGRPFLSGDAPERTHCFGGRDRIDEQFERIRSVRSRRWLYLRNYHPELPWAQRSWYMDRMPAMQAWRRLHTEGGLTPVQAAWFARRKPAEELYDCEADPWQLRNLASDPAQAAVLAEHRQELERHLTEVGDLAAVPEPELYRRGVLIEDHFIAEYRSWIAPLPAPCDNLGGPWDELGRPWSGRA